MQCFQWCVLLFLITALRSCVSHPLGIRVASLAKQYAALEDSEFDDYDVDDNDDDSNDRIDHLRHDEDIDDNDKIYDDYDDVNDLNDNVDHDDNEVAFNDNDVDRHNAAFEENNASDDDDDDIGRITGYRPDVALTSPFEYYN
ncbi:prostatic spermine-binding protein-like [Zeugodacus cucurbitae]|uniref:prostatic spermine-binding protein-like n=1 Tax=Zeugodacus cucurbitae TaxID=28588 RepID=UPI0023D95A4C|nr:prostatic spermine-binding protein-like [Zeugodacus cucurbitae]